MSDTEQKTPNKAASSGGAWSDQEKVRSSLPTLSFSYPLITAPQIAYLLVLCEHAADTDKFEGKTNVRISLILPLASNLQYLTDLPRPRWPHSAVMPQAHPAHEGQA
jgi:hypothetical protein